MSRCRQPVSGCHLTKSHERFSEDGHVFLIMSVNDERVDDIEPICVQFERETSHFITYHGEVERCIERYDGYIALAAPVEHLHYVLHYFSRVNTVILTPLIFNFVNGQCVGVRRT